MVKNKHSFYFKKCDTHLYLDIKPAYLIYFLINLYTLQNEFIKGVKNNVIETKNYYLDKLELSKHDIGCDKVRKFGK